jgi:hypothetical protein
MTEDGDECTSTDSPTGDDTRPSRFEDSQKYFPGKLQNFFGNTILAFPQVQSSALG